MTKTEFDKRRGIASDVPTKLFSVLKCHCPTGDDENIALRALEDEGYIWSGTRDNPTAHRYAPCNIVASYDGTISVEYESASRAVSVDEFLKMLPFMERR